VFPLLPHLLFHAYFRTLSVQVVENPHLLSHIIRESKRTSWLQVWLDPGFTDQHLPFPLCVCLSLQKDWHEH
jgi:hypothetical protein